MELNVKDVLYLITTVGAFGALWFRIGKGWAKIDDMERQVNTVKKILFKENGELSLVTFDQCRERQAVLQRAQEKSDAAYDAIQRELRELSNNVLIIMVHLNIDVDDATKRGVKNVER